MKGWLDKLDSGRTLTYQMWEDITGTPWKTARKMGLTSGSYDDNIKIRERLQKEGNFLANLKREKVDNTPLSRVDRMVDMRTSPQNTPIQPRQAELPTYPMNQELQAIPQRQIPRDESVVEEILSRNPQMQSFTAGLAAGPREYMPTEEMSPIQPRWQLPAEQPSELPYREPYVNIPEMQERSVSIQPPLPEGLEPIIPHKVKPVAPPVNTSKPVAVRENVIQAPNSAEGKQAVAAIRSAVKSANLFPDDVKETLAQKIGNKKFETYNGKYFIVSKENSQIYAFDKNHRLIDSTVAGRGKTPGDFPNISSLKDPRKAHATTRAGNAVISEVDDSDQDIRDYGTPFFRINYADAWKSSEGLGLHGIYKSEYAFRKAMLEDPSKLDKLMSWGCINVDPKWLMQPKVKPVVGDSIFITKEPVRNLKMTAQKSFKDGGELKKFQPGGMMFVPGEHQEYVARNTLHMIGEAYKPIEEVIFAPQKGLTKMFSGSYEYPSHAMNIHNPWLGLAADLVLDPMNLVGVGLLSSVGKINRFAKTAGKVNSAMSSIKNIDRVADVARGSKDLTDTLTKGYAAVNTVVPMKNVGIDMETKYVENLIPKQFPMVKVDRLMMPKPAMQHGGVIRDPMGQWAHPGEITEIPSNNITMRGVNYPVLGISDKGDAKLMKPGKNYKFKGKKVIEYPMAKNGAELTKLDQLTNFTNYNKPTRGGWLDKYK